MRRARRIPALAAAVAAAALVVVVVVVVPAAPAGAENQPMITNLTPSPGALFPSPAVTISGTVNFTPDFGYVGGTTNIAVAVTFKGHALASCDGCGNSNNSGFGYNPPGLTSNGPYGAVVNVTANETTVLGLNPQTRTASARTNFNVAVKPAAPRTTATVNADGTVTVTWSRNSEPDLIGYQIKRQGANVIFVGQSGALSWTDTATTQGGGFNYAVSAARPGADGTAATVLYSDSNSAPAAVPIPPPPTTILPAIGLIPVPDSTTTTALPPSNPASPDLSAFLAQTAKARAGTPAGPGPVAGHSLPAPQARGPGQPPAPDTYDPTLPFGSAGSRADAGGAGAPRVALPGRPSAATHRPPSLLYSVAGGMLLCVLGLAIRSANRRSDAPLLEPVGCGGATSPPRQPRGRGPADASPVGDEVPAPTG